MNREHRFNFSQMRGLHELSLSGCLIFRGRHWIPRLSRRRPSATPPSWRREFVRSRSNPDLPGRSGRPGSPPANSIAVSGPALGESLKSDVNSMNSKARFKELSLRLNWLRSKLPYQFWYRGDCGVLLEATCGVVHSQPTSNSGCNDPRQPAPSSGKTLILLGKSASCDFTQEHSATCR